MIPQLIDLGSPSPWAVLPPGIYDATVDEVRERFATTPHRRWLFEGLLRVLAALATAGCRTVYLDGSFVTAKPHPNDYDGCWDYEGVDFVKLDPVLLSFDNKRAAQKAKYLGEMFPAFMETSAGLAFLDLQQLDKTSSRRKGILRLSLAPGQGVTA